jgi:UPF0755 protein
LILFYAAGIPLSIPNYAEKAFGPPTDELSLIDKIYLSTMLILQTRDLTSPSNSPGLEIPFIIEIGESPVSVIKRLSDLGLITNSGALRNYLVYSGLDKNIQAGEFTLSGGMTPIEIVNILQDSSPLFAEITILAGWRVEEIADALQYTGVTINQDNFLEEVINNKAEGFLYPGVYTFPRDITATPFVKTFINSFNNAITQEIKNGFDNNNLSFQEAITLASIVEREAVIDEEMPIIASVFINRLKIGMKLDADPTVQYALGFNYDQGTWWTNPLSLSDLEVDSPYNTYLYPGLPPGPICNPGLNALRAVAFPAQTPYYYFRATCDNSGRHYFAETFEEHSSNACP